MEEQYGMPRYLSQGGRIGYDNGGISTMMASAPDPMDALNDMSMEVFGKPLNLLNEDEFQMLIDMANDQAMGIGNEQGIASLV